MNRNLIIGLVVVALLVLAGGVYVFMNRSNKTPAAPFENSLQPSVAASSSTEKISLKSFMSMGGNQKCQFSDPQAGNSGEVYIASGKFRGDFSSNINGKVTPSHMINDTKDVYIWMDDQPTGFKTTLSAIEEVSGTTGSTQTVDLNKKVDYKCQSWNADASKFSVPTDKKFNDVGKMMQDVPKTEASQAPTSQAPTFGAGSNAAACAACDNYKGEAVTQCKKAIGCK